MADIKFSEFPKANQSKDSDEIAILQDGVNKMIASPVLESKIINKTVSRVIDQGSLSLNLINPIGVVPTYTDLALITPTPELNDAYQVEADGLVYVYTENGFQADGEGFMVQPEPIGVVEEGNTFPVSGGEVFGYALNKNEFFNEVGYVNKYYGNRDDTSTGVNYRSTFFLKIKDRNNLIVTGYSGATNNVALVGFFDRSLNFLGHYNTATTGAVNNFKIPTESIPADAVFVKVSRSASQTGYVGGVDVNLSMVSAPSEDLFKNYFFVGTGHINKYNGDVDTSSVNTYQHTKFLRIINREGLSITNGYSGASNAIALCSFYDSKFNFIGYYNTDTTGVVNNVNIPTESIPDNAVFVRFTKRGATLSYIYGVDFNEGIGTDIAEYLFLKMFAGNTKYQTVSGFVNKNNGIFTDALSTYRITNFYRIINREELEINKGFSGATNNVALAGFYDAKLNFLGHYNTGVTGGVTNVQIPTESIPADAVFVRFTTNTLDDLSIKGAERHRVDMIELEQYINKIKIDIQDTTFLSNESQLFAEVGYINKTNGKFDTSGTSYRSSLFLKLVDPNNLIITGFSGVTNNAALVSFYDKNLNWLGYHNSPTHGIVNNYNVDSEEIPDGTYYVRFTRFIDQAPFFSGVSNDLNPVESWRLIDAVNNQIPTLTNIKPARGVKPNPDKGGYLKFLNYLGNNQNIHPKVLYFDSGWNGYKYWMAYTPYPSGNVEHENPCIAASNDGMIWETPTGLINPLELRPNSIERPDAYNSDTHLVYNDDTQQLECWWRSYDPSTTDVCIKRRVSLDGILWQPTEIIYDWVSDGQVSQSVIYENGIYKYWACKSGNIVYTESADVLNFPAFSVLPIEFASNGLHAWHMDVIKTPKGYEFAVQAWVIGVGNNNTSDLYYVLYDGATYSQPKLIVERGDLPTDDDYMGIYRASILYHEYNASTPRQGGYYFIYYSALGRNFANRNIFLTAGRSVDRLRGVNL